MCQVGLSLLRDGLGPARTLACQPRRLPRLVLTRERRLCALARLLVRARQRLQLLLLGRQLATQRSRTHVLVLCRNVGLHCDLALVRW